MHLLVDISAHGLGHLAQTAPVLDTLRPLLPGLRLTVRSALPRQRLAARIGGAFSHVAEARDFGLAMHNAVDVDRPASARRYREFHADWPRTVADEADWLRRHRVDAVLSNVAYLPLAGAAAAGIPCAGMSSLNWADMFAHYLGGEPGADAIHGQILAAYNSAGGFLRFAPGLPMAGFHHRIELPPVAKAGLKDRGYFSRKLDLNESERWLLVAMGGMDFPLDHLRWPALQGACWLVQGTAAARPGLRCFDPAEPRFADLLASCDLVVTKPGYGTFVEAACAGTPILYVERPDWPETPHFAAWLASHARAAAVSREVLQAGDLRAAIESLLARPAPTPPAADGATQAARILAALLAADRPPAQRMN